MAKTNYIRGTTPVGTAVYPWLNTPDTKFKAAGEYKTNLVLSAEDAAALKELVDREVNAKLEATKVQLNEDLKSATDGKKKAAIKKALTELKPSYPYKDAVDDEGEPTGDIEFTFKTGATVKDAKTGEIKSRTVPLYDAKKNEMSDSVYGGSRIKVAYELFPFYTSIAGAGVSLRIRAVQVIDLVTGGSGGSYGFDEEDGYETSAEAAKPAQAQGEDESQEDEENPDF